MKKIEVKENFVDKIIKYFDPVQAKARYKSRAMLAIAGGYVGASTARRQTERWSTSNYAPDSILAYDRQKLIDRSRDLSRNNPVASGAISSVCSSSVGTGLKLQSRIDRDALNLSDEQADSWEEKTEREFRLFSESHECDIQRTLNFTSIQDLVLRSTLESGDSFVLLPMIARLGSPYSLKLQVVESDRISNKDGKVDSDNLVQGIVKDKHGAPVAYQIQDQHPGNIYSFKARSWSTINAFGSKTGRRNVLHLYVPLRPGQSRGIPYLSPIIETLKQLDQYREAELTASIVSAMFTTFVKTESGEDDLLESNSVVGSPAGSKTNSDDYRLGNGAIITLAPGDDIVSANPNRPNQAFDAFFNSITQQIGVALEIPAEVLLKKFTASFSAARGALMEAWKFYLIRRVWLSNYFCQPVYETWLEEAISLGRVNAPGFFTDPAIRKAYSYAEWIGPAPNQLDELKQVNAAKERIKLGISTLSEETSALTGGDWEKKHRQRVKEHNIRKEDGLIETDNEEAQKDSDEIT